MLTSSIERTFATWIEAYNDLVQCPVEPIDLGDGREIAITKWAPEPLGKPQGRIKVVIEGMIIHKGK